MVEYGETFPIPFEVMRGDYGRNSIAERYKRSILNAMCTGKHQFVRIGDIIQIIYGDLSGMCSIKEDELTEWLVNNDH